ncbi:hypothetical protein Gotur_017669 [Gossypium turneri]
MPPKLRDKGKGKIRESSKTQISSKPIKSWYEICHEEENEKSSSSSKSSKNTIIQDAQDPNEIDSQIKKWIESLSQSPEIALAFSQMKEETPLKQIATEAAKISKNIEIFLHKPKSLKNVLKETSLQDVFPKDIANPRLCKSVAPNHTIAKFLQAKSIATAMLAQAKTKKEYKKLMAEMLSSLDSESEDEKSSASLIKTVDLADDTTSVTFTRTKKK